MKSRTINLAAIILLAFLGSACAARQMDFPIQTAGAIYPSQFILGDIYVLKAGETINGNIAGLGTSLVIKPDAQVLGDISLIGSHLEVGGQVTGDINILAGSSEILDTANIVGNINQSMQQLTISPNARIIGEINSFTFSSSTGSNIGQGIVRAMEWLRPARWLLLQGIRILGMLIISLIAYHLFDIPTRRASKAININPAASWGAGILSIFTIPLMASVMIITICLSPIGIGILGVYLVCFLWGWATLGFVMGQFLNKWLKLSWQEKHSGLVCTLLLAILFSTLSLIPCIGILINIMISSIGFGGVILSRFGTSS